MENKYSYRITRQYPETGKIVENLITLNKEVSIHMIPMIAVEKGYISEEDVNYITSIFRVNNNNIPSFYQADQILLKPREHYGTGKQFSHLMKDLQVTDEEYTVMIDIGKITKDEITIVIYPNGLKDVTDMTKTTISQVIKILNLNSTKIVAVNYILNNSLTESDDQNLGFCNCDKCDNTCKNVSTNLNTYSKDEYIDYCNKCDNTCKNVSTNLNTYSEDEYIDYCNKCDNKINKNISSHPILSCDDEDSECCANCNDDTCDECDEKCKCYKDPDFDCCKNCDMTDECGCYISKTNRHEFTYKGTKSNEPEKYNEPEKTIRIPVNPLNPKDEIVMLASAIAKRLDMLSVTDGEALITVRKISDDRYESELKINVSDNSYYTL